MVLKGVGERRFSDGFLLLQMPRLNKKKFHTIITIYIIFVNSDIYCLSP